MSGPTNNTNDNRLKALLNKQKSQEQPADDFEREALEGFAMLESQEEALNLKAELDQEMKDKVFSRKPVRIYWMAAAGLTLLIGISTYFILAGDPVTRSGLAITAAASKADSLLAAPPAESSYEEKAAELSSVAPSKQVNTLAAKAPKGEPEAPGFASGIVAPAIPAKETGAAPAELSFAANGGVVSTTNADLDEAQAPVKAAEKELVQPSATDAYARVAADKKAEERKDDSNAETAKKSRAKVKSYAATPAAAREEVTDTAQNCYYVGSKFELYQQLSRRLGEKDLDRHFDATLFFTGASTRVQKVEFTKTENISPEAQREIIKVLKTLDGFRFRSKPAKNEVTEYKISR
jgi:hypothetical protein